ncbi:hypothetical protein BpHYR1_012846 [Brachionus plicatilis]|uniref:Uncharacterized protein n=1 Tax=Brachionus plicatilis TaxID=10195 RepID=A0A3M7S533_BRAPC|nr:hypothetical protein BpHYR1_012846 [Brachionus plicatilis]
MLRMELDNAIKMNPLSYSDSMIIFWLKKLISSESIAFFITPNFKGFSIKQQSKHNSQSVRIKASKSGESYISTKKHTYNTTLQMNLQSKPKPQTLF